MRNEQLDNHFSFFHILLFCIILECVCLMANESDENGNIELIAGVTAIAATYLIEKTLYINCSSIADYVKTRAKEDE